MSSKILCIGDVHFSACTEQYTDVLHEHVVKKILPSLGINLKVVLLGDILHNHEKVFTNSFNKALNFIKDICEHPNVIKVYLIIGNHDYINNKQFLTDNHPFNACKNWNKLVVVDKVVADGKLIFTPFVPDKRFLEALDASGLPWKTYSCIFSHVCISGASYGAITLTPEGADVWKPEYPLLVSGHVHDTQYVGSNVIYTGASYQIQDGEDTDKKLFVLGESQLTDDYYEVLIEQKIPEKIANMIVKYISIEWEKPIKIPQMPLKGILRMKIKDYSERKTEGKKWTRFELSGKKEEIEEFKASRKFQKLKEEGVVCFKVIKDKEEINEHLPQRKFMEIFTGMLTEEEKGFLQRIGY
jgi:DNA repair exonuclease SbcCD nuclease subunit